MAKPNKPDEQSIANLAEKLFVANWMPGSSYQPDHVAKQCFEAAEGFMSHKRSRETKQEPRIAEAG
jgi:hypothetical protein